MKKEFKNILEKSLITIKWRNFNQWQKQEGITNLLEACEYYNINIRKNGEVLTIKLDGNIKIIYKSSICYLERDLVTVIVMYNQYLGDTATIKTRFGSVRVN